MEVSRLEDISRKIAVFVEEKLGLTDKEDIQAHTRVILNTYLNAREAARERFIELDKLKAKVEEAREEADFWNGSSILSREIAEDVAATLLERVKGYQPFEVATYDFLRSVFLGVEGIESPNLLSVGRYAKELLSLSYEASKYCPERAFPVIISNNFLSNPAFYEAPATAENYEAFYKVGKLLLALDGRFASQELETEKLKEKLTELLEIRTRQFSIPLSVNSSEVSEISANQLRAETFAGYVVGALNLAKEAGIKLPRNLVEAAYQLAGNAWDFAVSERAASEVAKGLLECPQTKVDFARFVLDKGHPLSEMIRRRREVNAEQLARQVVEEEKAKYLQENPRKARDIGGGLER